MTHRPPTAPLLLTHLDPSLYPVRALPLLHELVIHILAHGEVWLKEVDLFLNSRIRAQLSQPANLRIFASLVDTGRIKILIPDKESVPDQDLDPQDHPLLVTARARDNKKPLKSKPWVLTEEIKQFCTRLDSILGHAARHERNPGAVPICRHRVTPPADENEFATKLYAVLTQANTKWRERGPFGGISDKMAAEFADFCLNYEKALALLVAKNVRPNASNGFYRSLAYQCADQFPEPEQQPMKNLVQSVYAYCELKREGTAGTYAGKRMAEMPPDKPATQAYPEVIRRIEVVPLLGNIPIPVDTNIGQVISNVLAKCDQSLRVFWNLAGSTPSPEQDFRAAWNHIAAVFASEVGLPQKSTKHRILGPAGLVIGGATLGMGVGGLAGFSWNTKVIAAEVALGAIATFGVEAVDLFRRVQLHFQRQRIADAVSGAATIRCSKIE